MSLSARVHSNMAFTSVGAGVALGIDLTFTAILSRLLSPHDYGVVAAAMLLIALCDLLRDVGIGSTIVQLPKLTAIEQRTGLTIVLVTSLLIFACAQMGAPLFAGFMHIPEVEPVLRVLAFIILIQAISTISQGLLLRDLRARRVMAIEIASKFIAYASLGIGLAYLGYGYWALVAASLFEALLRSIGFAMAARPVLRPAFDRPSLRRLTSLGSGFALSRIINFVALRADVTVVGRYLDAASLGIYSRAYKLMSMPAELYAKVADRIVFPALAQVQADAVRLQRAYLRGIHLTALLGLPMTVMLCLLAPEVVAVLLGDKWSAVVPVFFALSAATYFRLSARVSASLLRATASTRAMISSQVVYATLTIVGSLLAVPHGLVAVGVTISAAVLGHYLLTTWYACRVAGATLRQMGGAHRHGLLLSVVAGSVTFPVLLALRDMEIPAVIVLLSVSLVLGVLGLVLMLGKPRILLGDEGVDLATRVHDGLAALGRRTRST